MTEKEYNDLLGRAQDLNSEDLLRLASDLEAIARKKAARPRRSILELKGMGKEVWEGMDAQEYVDRERSSWNG
ncbi:MAG: hypothetical protein NTV04_20220 [Deltaproteobacteria bacterium]|jgi:hypothetical protein|nr:hypothetical protein [Deltaproteobacteria bacterium]